MIINWYWYQLQLLPKLPLLHLTRISSSQDLLSLIKFAFLCTSECRRLVVSACTIEGPITYVSLSSFFYFILLPSRHIGWLKTVFFIFRGSLDLLLPGDAVIPAGLWCHGTSQLNLSDNSNVIVSQKHSIHESSPSTLQVGTYAHTRENMGSVLKEFSGTVVIVS